VLLIILVTLFAVIMAKVALVLVKILMGLIIIIGGAQPAALVLANIFPVIAAP